MHSRKDQLRTIDDEALSFSQTIYTNCRSKWLCQCGRERCDANVEGLSPYLQNKHRED